MMDFYTQKIEKADDKIIKRFHQTHRQFERAYRMSVYSTLLVSVVGVIILVLSLLTFFGFNARLDQNIAIGGVLVGVVLLVIVYFRNPLALVRQSTYDMVKMNVIFMGFVRQVSQIDYTFKDLYMKNGANLDNMVGTVEQVRQAVDQTIDNLGRAMEDINSLMG